jgi:arsenate reductase (glutaredoxin)
MTVYGIKNCDTMKKAFDWLKENKIEYDFHDYKKSGIDKATIQDWLKSFPKEQVINTKGTTWKQLSDEQKSSISKIDDAIELMISKPSMIKRPLVKLEKGYLLGFEVEKWGEIFKI